MCPFIHFQRFIQGPFTQEQLAAWQDQLRMEMLIEHQPTGIWATLPIVLALQSEGPACDEGPAMFDDIEMEDSEELVQWVAQARVAGELVVVSLRPSWHQFQMSPIGALTSFCCQ